MRALILAAIAACSEARTPAVWSEFMTDADVRAQLPFLAEQHADLYLALHAERIGDSALAELIAEAHDSNVSVRAWLLLPEADGYWPNETNLPQVRDAALRLADWNVVDWIELDLEMSLARTTAIQQALMSNGIVAALDLIKAGRDPVAFAAHRDELAALVDDLHDRGLRVGAVTYPMILDDTDGDFDIEDEFDAPVTGIDWDEVSVMVYQSLFAQLTNEWHGPEVVYSYAKSMREAWGERAAIALGIVGTAGIVPTTNPYPDAATLAADRAAAQAAGIDQLSVYSLDGLLQMPEAARADWLAPVAAQKPTGPEDTIRRLFAGLFNG